jgi:MOSC domain-containing protein YiiM
MLLVRHIYISAGHNFFGHQGQPAGQHPMLEVEQVDCVAGRGLRGDRFFDYQENYKGQITFYSWEIFEQLRVALDLPDASPSATRRNIVTEGVDLLSWVGRAFMIQGIHFEGVEECRPCHWMNGALKDGAEAWMKGRGGLRARILTDGILKRDIRREPDPIL